MGNKKIQILVFAVLILSTFSIGIVSSQDGSPWPRVENISVTPPKGYYNDVFNFSLAMLYFNNTTIELEIPHAITTKTLRKTGKYTNPEKWQPIRWNVTFDPSWEGMIANYKIYWSGREIAQEAGPFIIPRVTAEFKNASVVPEAGYYNTLYTYSVWVNLNKREEIALEVYNMSSKKWEMRGNNQSNTKLSVPEKLTWSPITNIASADCIGGLGKFRFVFRDVNSSESYESEIYRDPFLLPPTEVKRFKNIFKNATVTPSSGGYNTSFDYSVEPVDVLNYVSNVSDIHLVVWNPHTWKEQNFENATLANSSLKWSIKPFENDKKCKGFAQYYFTYNGTRWPETVPLYGPAINMTGPPGPSGSGGGGGGGGGYYEPRITYKNATVDPSWVSMGVRGKKSFNYSVVVDKGDPLVLEIYNLSYNNWEKVGEGNNRKYKDDWKHEWTVDLILNEDWVGLSKYRFYPKGGVVYASQIYYGPEIKMRALSEWKEEIGYSEKALKEPKIACDVTPGEGKWFTEFTYTADITQPNRVDMTVALFVYKPGSGTWEPVSWRGYRYNPIVTSSDYDAHNTATVRWSIEKMEIFNEADAGKESRYYIWYWDGDNEYDESSGYNEGPMLLANHEPELERAFPPEPEYGSTHTVYTYTFEVNDPDDETVQGWLTVIDPLNEEHVIEGTGKEGVIKFRVEPGLGIFTEDKLREYISKTNEALFTSQYRLEYWDEGMEVMGKTKTTEWFVGPNVSLVNVQPYGEPPKPERGKYADEFEYGARFYSSRENTIRSYLTIYDPSDPEHAHQTFTTKDLSVASDTTGRVTWRVKPEVFGPDDFGMTARYEIAWEDQYGNKGVINGTGPYIERAVPLLSVEPPLVPILMVIAPLVTFVLSLLIVAPRFGARLREWLRI